MKKHVVLTESDIRRMVKKSVRRIIKEEERSFPNSIPGSDGIHFPGDVDPDVLDALSRGDYGDDEPSRPDVKDMWKRQYASCLQEIPKRIKTLEKYALDGNVKKAQFEWDELRSDIEALDCAKNNMQ